MAHATEKLAFGAISAFGFFFGSFERDFGLLALADVAHQRQHELIAAGLEHSQARLDRKRRAVLTPVRPFARDGLFGNQLLPCRLPTLGIESSLNFEHSESQQLFSRVAQAVARSLVHVPKASVAANDEESIGGLRHQLPEAGFAFEQRF